MDRGEMAVIGEKTVMINRRANISMAAASVPEPVETRILFA
jgi:hypothetical protein